LVKLTRASIAIPVTLLLGLALGGTAVADPPQAPGSKASAVGQSHRSAQAEKTLAEVQAIVSGDARSRGGRTTDGRDLTVALRDLRIQMSALSPADQKEAQRYLMRPGSAGDPYITGALPINKCFVELCIHYAETGANAVLGSDGDANTIPTYVQQVADTINQINIDYVAAGYKTPKRDGAVGGGTNKIDIYLGDIGPQHLYGFCTSDDPNNPDTSHDYSLWAYCALDNDYDPSEFPTNTPTENMQVTAAHEFFHAVQYAYDAYEDGWILESTATWAEDEMFDAVNDNRQYLSNSPLSAPYIPLDYFGDGYHYGTWLWWRYLTEKYTAKTGKLPNLVRKVWERLDGTTSGPDDYSTQGLSKVLNNLHSSLPKELQGFYSANLHPATVYEEGKAYKATKPAKTIGISPSKANPLPQATKIDHMTALTLRLTPKKLSKPDWKLKLAFDAPPTARGGAFVVTVYKKGGGISTTRVGLNKKGNATKTFPFSSGTIAKVDVTFVNTSSRFNCWQNATPYSCFGGIPRDDHLKYVVDPKAFRA
jgi:hypothetical protein